MCGIAGFTHLRRPGDTAVARRIADRLYHRGPDQQGIHEGSEATLCAVRLKIIDLAGGDQPMVSEDGDTAIAFNGEIYNHQEMRAELEGLGHRFRSNCDTETVLQAFLQWDTDAFRGCAACSRWRCGRESQRRLVLARDRMGIKPLYYYRARRRDIFRIGAEGDSGASGACPRRLDLEALDTYLSVNYVPGPRTLIEGIEKVPPGHLIGMAAREGAAGGVVEIAGRAGRGSVRWKRPRKNWTGCCATPCGSTWWRTFRWECGHRAGWIRRPILHYAAHSTARGG